MGYDKRTVHIVSAIIEYHGYYQTTPENFDLAMQKYLPASIESLRALLNELNERNGNEIDYSDLKTITECLFVLSEYDGNNI